MLHSFLSIVILIHVDVFISNKISEHKRVINIFLCAITLNFTIQLNVAIFAFYLALSLSSLFIELI